MATLRKKNGNYFIDYRLNGKRFRKNVGRAKKIAELALKDLEVKIARKELGFEEKDSNLAQLFLDFEKYGQTNLAPGTRIRYKSIVDNFKRFLATYYPNISKISHFTPRVFEDFKSFRKEEGAQNRTINSEMIVVRMMFRLAVQWGYAKDNPTDGVSKLRVPTKNAPRFLTKEECQKLLSSCGEWLYPIFYAFLNTGMRKSELENLEWADIDFDRRKIMIRVKDDWTPKTDEREIPMNDGLYELLKKQKANVNGSKYVFRWNNTIRGGTQDQMRSYYEAVSILNPDRIDALTGIINIAGFFSLSEDLFLSPNISLGGFGFNLTDFKSMLMY